MSGNEPRRPVSEGGPVHRDRYRPIPEILELQVGGIPPKSIGDLLGEPARRLGVPTPTVSAALFSRWDSVVGPAIAAHARPVALEGSTLVVECDGPAWATELRYLTADIVARLAPHVAAGVITEISLRISGASTGRTPSKRPVKGRSNRSREEPPGW